MEPAELLGHLDLPVDILCWLNRLGALEFSWAWEPDGPAVGQVSVPDLEELSQLEPAEASSKLAAVRTTVAQAFIEPSQQQDIARLLSNSALPFSTTNCLVQGLIEKNIDPKQAKALVKWLGEEARILLYRTETEEGRRRDEVLAATSESDTDVERLVVNRLNMGPALEKHHWMKLLAQHSAFLESGAVEGAFELTSERGVPSVSFKSDATAPGQALLCCENLTGANMKEARLAYAGLVGVRAEKVSFASADLSHACLRYSTLSGSKFSLGDLTNCDFSDANLEGVDFRGANLTGTNFERSNLTGANFAGALTKGTKFGAANLRGVKY